MLSPRWTKLLRDVMLTPGRTALMALAMAAGICGLATMLSSYTILSRETTWNYRATNPPAATLQLEHIDEPLLAAARGYPGIATAQAGATAHAVLLTADGRALPLTIFMQSDFETHGIGKIEHEAGAWPPPPGALLLEREALQLVGGHLGDSVAVRTGNGAPRQVTIAGTVHDAALPPATRGLTVYAYATPATVAALGLDGTLRELKLSVSERPLDIDAIEATVAGLARQLQDKGYRINAIRIPPPGEHPHQKVMNSILIMLSVFGAVAAVLSAVLSATILGAILAQQTRQIGVMKAIGAANGQVARLYLVLVLALASTATLLGGYAGLAGGRAFAAVVLQQILNFSMHSSAVPHWVYLAIVVAGVIVPLLISAVPILRATGVTPKAAMSDVGSRGHYFVAPARWHERLDWLDRTLVMALRNSMRRRGRLLLTLVLLSSAGAVFLSSMNVRAASDDHLQQAAADRRYDIELALRRAVPAEQVARVLAALPEVRLVEPWERSTATRARPDGLPIERIYPDGAHGTLALAAVPASNATLKLTMLDGSWLDGRQATAVLNSEALESFPDAKVGQDIALAWKGRDVKLRVVGIARQYMSSATVFVPADTYADLTGQRGMASTYRIVLKMHDAGAIDAAARRIEAALAGAGIEVRLSVTETMMRKEVDGHFDLLMAAMLFISLLMAAVGLFGLGSAMSSSVAERGREFGIMRAIGATHGVVLRNVLCEGLAIALMSLAPAFLLALPVSAAIGNFLGNLLFGLPFPLVVSGPAVLDWIGLILCCALLASGLPAWHASRISVRRSFACL